MTDAVQKGRLSRLQAAMVIARRDFGAILFSRAFLFFLLGPLFPLLVGALAGGVGSAVRENTAPPELGLAMATADVDAMLAARANLGKQLGSSIPPMFALKRLGPGEDFDATAAMKAGGGHLGGVVTGTLDAPVLTAPSGLQWWKGPVGLVAGAAQSDAPAAYPEVSGEIVATSGASETQGRLKTAQAGLLLLFMLIVLLSGMVVSNLVEEKGNKIIEILAAAIPMDAVFFGKLFAMLAISIVGICVWGSVIGLLVALSGNAGPMDGIVNMSNLPTPGVGWPMFLLLSALYFSMGYLLVGSVFLAVGSLATTVREVQTLSMPLTMAQIMLFFFASLAVTETGRPLEWAAIIFPFSSFYAMLGRAAQFPELWPHAAALAWQALWVAITIRFGSALFRKRVMKSGPQGTKKSRPLVKLLASLFSRGSVKSA